MNRTISQVLTRANSMNQVNQTPKRRVMTLLRSAIFISLLSSASLYAAERPGDQSGAGDSKPQFYARVVDPIFTPKEDFKISPSDYPNGVYVVVQKGSLFSKPTRFEKVETILSAKLKQQGFKIAESKEAADASFVALSSIDFSEIQKNENDKLARGLSIADDVIGMALGAKWSGGQSLLVNGINVQIHKKRHWSVFQIVMPDGKEVGGGVNVGAEYSEDTPLVSAALFELSFDEWAAKRLEHPQVSAPQVTSTSPSPIPSATPDASTTDHK